MIETVVHVTTLDQWKSVLDVWFAQGYEWFISKGYREDYFRNGIRQLRLNHIDKIIYSGSNLYSEDDCIEYADFMAQQEKTMAKETYYVTQEQLDLIEELKTKLKPLSALLTGFSGGWRKLDKVHIDLQKQVLRYIGGDTSVVFKVKEQLYRLRLIDENGSRAYMKFIGVVPDWTFYKNEAFTATREEIEKWKTPAWEIEEAD